MSCVEFFVYCQLCDPLIINLKITIMDCFFDNLPGAGTAMFAFMIPLFISVFFIALNASVIKTVALWFIYRKADQPGWACLIPVYDTLVLLRIVGKPWWWILLFLIPIVNIVFVIWMYNMLSKSFGKTAAFTVGLIFFPVIFTAILGFGESEYVGPGGKSKTEE